MARRRTSRRYRGGDESFARGSVRGIDEAVRRFRELGEHVLTAAKRALMVGAYDIVNDAKSRVPVKTGKLRDSIMAVKMEDGAAYDISADAKNENGIPYGQFVEFDPRINHPFLYPALDENIDTIKEDVKRAIQGAIRRGH